ncbi:MAG: neutral zinc metallopeptidase [Phycisphaerales bacterium]
MRWQGRRQSRNIEDRRLQRGGGKKVVAGGGLGTIAIIIIVILLGGNPQQLIQSLPAPQQGSSQSGNQRGNQSGGFGNSTTQTAELTAEDQQQAAFVATVLADTEDVWNSLLAQQGTRYAEPTLVLFRDQVQSACGFASSASGPFYCPADQKVYLDLSFFDELARKFQAPGDFAQAYVIAHEVGHHVQHLMGITGRVHSMRRQISQEEYNALSVRLELQADFLAGVWAHHAQRTKNILESGDIQEALRAASSIGDDTIQKRMQGYVVPESFTHGTSDQRIKWFTLGYETGDLSKGDTFNSPDP